MLDSEIKLGNGVRTVVTPKTSEEVKNTLKGKLEEEYRAREHGEIGVVIKRVDFLWSHYIVKHVDSQAAAVYSAKELAPCSHPADLKECLLDTKPKTPWAGIRRLVRKGKNKDEAKPPTVEPNPKKVQEWLPTEDEKGRSTNI